MDARRQRSGQILPRELIDHVLAYTDPPTVECCLGTGGGDNNVAKESSWLWRELAMRTGLVARSEKIWDSPLSLSPRDVVFERYRRFADRAFIGVCEPPSLEATEKELPMWDNKQQRPLAKSARARLATRRIDPAVLLRYDVHGRWTAVARRGHRSIVVVQENGGSQNHYCVNVATNIQDYVLVNDANDQTLYAIVLSFHDPHIVVWDVKSGHRAQRIPLPEAVRHRVCITADDTQLLLCDDAHLLVRVNDTTVLQYVIGQDEFGMVLELRDGHFNVDRGIVLQQCWTMSGTGEENAVEMLAVTRDGRVIVDWAQTVQLHVLREHMSTFTDIHLGADIIGAEFQSDSKDYFYPRHIITVTKRGIVRCHVCRSTIGSEFTLDSRWSLSASLTDGEFARTMHVDWSMHLLYIGTSIGRVLIWNMFQRRLVTSLHFHSCIDNVRLLIDEYDTPRLVVDARRSSGSVHSVHYDSTTAADLLPLARHGSSAPDHGNIIQDWIKDMTLLASC